ncbi:MAG: HD domain-containing phosphohydrolase [Oscillochloridaceae bacterium umkhey_bin13]
MRKLLIYHTKHDRSSLQDPSDLLRHGARFSGLLALTLGASVLLGWVFDLAMMTSLGTDLPAMVPSTALGFAGIGLALWLHMLQPAPPYARGVRILAIVLAAGVAALGLGVMTTHMLNGPLALGPWPDRIPFATATSLACLGLSLLFIGFPQSIAWAQFLALLATLNGVRMIFGFIDGAGSRYLLASPVDVALHSGFGTVLVGLGTLCAHPRQGLMQVVTGPGYGSYVLRLLLPVAVVLPLLIGGLTIRSQAAGIFGLSIGMLVLTCANLVAFWWLARALNASEQATSREAERAHAMLDLAELRTGRLQALREVDQAILHDYHAADAMLAVLLAQTCSQLKADAATVWLIQSEHERLVCLGQQGLTHLPAPLSLTDDPGCLGAALTQATVVGSEQAPLPVPLVQAGFQSGCAAPLLIAGEIAGVLAVAYQTPRRLDAESRHFLEALAGQGAIALATSRLFNDLEQANQALVRAYDETLAGWSHALELRDDETEGHTRRVTDLTVRLARAYGVPEAEIVHLRRGALLHDIGKLGIPDSILLKRGKLTPDEWAIMRRHPTYAYQWLRPISYLWPALAIPYCHHERWDGSGYPRGLKGEAIPLAARLFAVVDVWDALCAERPYHTPWPAEQVKAYLQTNAGILFDPDVVAVFLDVIADEAAPQWREAGR